MLRPSLAAALAGWQQLIDADAEQVARLRQDAPTTDHYAQPPAALLAAPGQPEASVAALAAMVAPGERWIDIGAGAGRYALPLAAAGAHVTAIEPSAGMRAALTEATPDQHAITLREGRWPETATGLAADVILAAHVTYDIAEIEEFLAAMEAAAPRRILVLVERSRGASLADLFGVIHGEPMALLPAAVEHIALLHARGQRLDVRTVTTRNPDALPPEQALAIVRRLLWLAPDSAKAVQAEAIVRSRWTTADGNLHLPANSRWTSIVSW